MALEPQATPAAPGESWRSQPAPAWPHSLASLASGALPHSLAPTNRCKHSPYPHPPGFSKPDTQVLRTVAQNILSFF